MGDGEARAARETGLVRRTIASGALLASLALAPPLRAEDTTAATTSRFGLSTGLDFSSGDYGDPIRTDIWYVPVALRYERGPWSAKLTLPFVSITGPGNVVGGTDGFEVIGNSSSTQRMTDLGLGDIVLGGSYALEPWVPAMPWLELGAKVKFPSASRRHGLGTGELDYSVQLDVSKSFGRLTPFATVGYRIVGSPPGSDLANTAFASIGAAWRWNARWTSGLAYDWRQTASRSGDSHELTPYVSWKWRDDLTFGPYAVIGLSREAPDYGLGFQLTYWR